MRMVPAVLLLFIVFCGVDNVSASSKDPLTQKEWLALKEVSQESVKTTFKTFLKDATNQKFPTPTAWGPTIYKLKSFCEHPFFEADTGFKREWMRSVYTVTMRLVKIQNTKRMCKIAGNKQVYAQMDAKFDVAKDQLQTLMKHPKKVDSKRLAVLRKAADKKRLAIRKKLEASGWSSSTTEPPTKPAPKKSSRRHKKSRSHR